MGRPRAFSRVANRSCHIGIIEHRHRREPHDRTIARRMRIDRTRDRVARLTVSAQSGRDGATDVKTAAVAAEVAFLPPAAIAVHLVFWIEAVLFQKAGGETKGHRSIIRPLARLESERPASDHVMIGLNEPGGLNSSVVPTASPTASPSKQPRKRSFVSMS